MPKFTRTELDFVVEPQVRQFCGPIFFTHSLETAVGNVTANGSFGLVDTGSKKMLVTCSHVWKEYQNARRESSELKMCVCLAQQNPVVFAPDESLGEDPILDIATFDMAPLLAVCGGRKFFPLNQNPPPKIAKEDVVYFIGFPGNLRFVID